MKTQGPGTASRPSISSLGYQHDLDPRAEAQLHMIPILQKFGVVRYLLEMADEQFHGLDGSDTTSPLAENPTENAIAFRTSMYPLRHSSSGRRQFSLFSSESNDFAQTVDISDGPIPFRSSAKKRNTRSARGVCRRHPVIKCAVEFAGDLRLESILSRRFGGLIEILDMGSDQRMCPEQASCHVAARCCLGHCLSGESERSFVTAAPSF